MLNTDQQIQYVENSKFHYTLNKVQVFFREAAYKSLFIQNISASALQHIQHIRTYDDIYFSQ